MIAPKTTLLFVCLATSAGCAQILGIDQDYRELSEDGGDAEDAGGEPEDASDPEDAGEPEDTGAELDAAPEQDSGPPGFDCATLDGLVWNGHCYFSIAAGTGLIWTRAKTTCESFSDSHLATLTTSAEQAAIEGAFFPSTTDYWIGLSLQDPSSQTPPSSCKTTPGSCPFRWVTGEVLSFTKWTQRSGTDAEPNYTGACVRLQLTDRSWADFGCGAQLPAICEHD
jgi:hypothetical protein